MSFSIFSIFPLWDLVDDEWWTYQARSLPPAISVSANDKESKSIIVPAQSRVVQVKSKKSIDA